jgi:hypothetical protein
MNNPDFQSILDTCKNSIVDWSNRGIQQGTFHIRSTVNLVAEHTTFIGVEGPAFVIESGGVLKLNGGAIGTSLLDENCFVAGDLSSLWRPTTVVELAPRARVDFNNTILLGDISGKCVGRGQWHVPLSLTIPDIAPGRKFKFVIQGWIPIDVQLSTDIYSVKFSKEKLSAGAFELAIDIDAKDFRDGLFLDGWIYLKAINFTRPLHLSGFIRKAGISESPSVPIWTAQAFVKRPTIPRPSRNYQSSSFWISEDPNLRAIHLSTLRFKFDLKKGMGNLSSHQLHYGTQKVVPVLLVNSNKQSFSISRIGIRIALILRFIYSGWIFSSSREHSDRDL